MYLVYSGIITPGRLAGFLQSYRQQTSIYEHRISDCILGQRHQYI